MDPGRGRRARPSGTSAAIGKMKEETVFDLINEIDSQGGSRKSGNGSMLSPNSSRALGAREASTAPAAPAPAPPKKPIFVPAKVIALLSGLQFAVVILIAQRRVPDADNVEFFVVLSMLMLTAAHAKIIDFLPDSTSITSDVDVLIFLTMVVPVFVFMCTIEVWFIVYLFAYNPATDLIALGRNAEKVLTIAKVFGISKIGLTLVILALPRVIAVLSGKPPP